MIISGSAYFYNLRNLNENQVVGNIFYRNGKIILSNSGSVFDDLFKDRSNLEIPRYDISYKSQQTIYEKQILCRIEPGEFNYSTNVTALVPNDFSFDIDDNKYFDFKDLDIILSYISFKNYGDYDWKAIMDEKFDQSDEDWYQFYLVRENLENKDSTYYTPHFQYLESIYEEFDIDGNGKINLCDAYLFYRYFTNQLSKDVIFKNIDMVSSRKTLESLVQYLDEKTGKTGYGKINPEFFNYDYSSSVDLTGSYLAPFITTIGLYSGLDLVAVAKLGMPIKNSGELPLNILVKWDI